MAWCPSWCVEHDDSDRYSVFHFSAEVEVRTVERELLAVRAQVINSAAGAMVDDGDPAPADHAVLLDLDDGTTPMVLTPSGARALARGLNVCADLADEGLRRRIRR